MDILKPRDHAEEIAIFRHGMIGQLCARDLEHGDLAEALRALSMERVRPPGSSCTRTFAVPTLERWLYAYRQRGLEGLCPRARRDRGRGRELDPVLRKLLCDIRREHPDASVPLILRTLRADGRLSATVSASTVRRLFRQEGLDKIPQRDGKGPTTRLKWQAERPDALWHGDVCHGPTLHLDGRRVTVRIHALLDDASRFIVVLSVESDEKEDTLLRLLVRALRLYGIPDALYLDNGATYRGDALRLFCSRLGITLLHARPYDPQARGKMERFWRTLRENVLDHLGSVTSLQDISSRIQAFLDVHYHPSPHAGLIRSANSPRRAYEHRLLLCVSGTLSEPDRLRPMDVALVARHHEPEVLVPDRDLNSGFSTELVIQDHHRGNDFTEQVNKQRITRLFDPTPLSTLFYICAIFLGNRRHEGVHPWRILDTKALTIRRSVKKNYGTIIQVELERTVAWINPSRVLEQYPRNRLKSLST
ncbi:DDE-type integrase/transposase/recombinase [Sorangium sp. So ce315]|uniref:DDE-type integrase/transposase/recombinase n=1 Tax=Sorangium sp. So ce315 TaxID=3133299 RepID=UPI003F5DF2E9